MREQRIGIEEARATLGDLVDNARIAGTTTTITRHGKPAARLMPAVVPYLAGNQPVAAERIRSLVQRELCTLDLASADRLTRTTWDSRVAASWTSVERIFEIAPFRRLADEIGPGFETDTEPIGEDLAADVERLAAEAVMQAQFQLDAVTWPAPNSDHISTGQAARMLIEVAGLQRFITLMTGYEETDDE